METEVSSGLVLSVGQISQAKEGKGKDAENVKRKSCCFQSEKSPVRSMNF